MILILIMDKEHDKIEKDNILYLSICFYDFRNGGLHRICTSAR